MANCTRCIKFVECPWRSDPDSYCSAYEQRELTKADQIRNMSDEELCNEYFHILNNILWRYTDSRAGLLEWLKQPAEQERNKNL